MDAQRRQSRIWLARLAPSASHNGTSKHLPSHALPAHMLEDIKKTLWATADKLRTNMDGLRESRREVEKLGAQIT